MSEEWLTVAQAAERLKVSRETIYRLMREGKLPYSTIWSGRRRIKREDVDALIQGGER